MDLRLIEKTVVNTASAIANVLELDVIIVNTDLEIIGNTYKNMVDDEIYVTIESIVGQAVIKGEMQIFIDKRENERCSGCDFIDKCVIEGVFAVPIKMENKVIGAIGTIFKNKDIQEKVRNNKDGVVAFLQNMAELLSSKLRSVNQIRKIKEVNRERELIIETITQALVYIDNDGNINYYNRHFAKYFDVKRNIINQPITKIIKHNLIDQFLYNRKNINNSIFILDNADIKFIGLITCRNIKINDELVGTMMIFRRIEDAYQVINEISNNASYTSFDNMIYHDKKMGEIISKGKKLAIIDEHMLIKGQQGVGKQLFCSSIHNFSSRKKSYFLTIQCDEISRDNYLSELFGISDYGKNIGKFQLANGGTIVLDEIGELPLNIQLDLLQYLNTGKIYLEKGIVIKDVDVRLIATTSIDLNEKIASGDFNEELYYRLNKNNLTLPSLKDRSKEEFGELVTFYTKKYAYIYNKNIEINNDGLDILYEYNWPGNIKQLKKVLEKLVYKCKGDKLSNDKVRAAVDSLGKYSLNEDKILSFDEYEKQIIKNALVKYKDHKNSKAIVANKLGIGRATLYRKIDKYGLD